MKTNMKNKIVILAACALALTSSAAPDGLVTKSASGTTAATVYFAGGSKPLRVTSLDVTSDKASSVAAWAVGTTSSTLAISQTNGATNFTVFGATALSANDVILLQNSSDVVTNATVHGKVSTTNATFLLGNSIGTNLAIGDTVNKRLNTAYTLMVSSASSDTNFIISATNGLAADDVVIAQPPGGTIYKRTVFGIENVTNKSVPLRAPLERPLSIGDSVYERQTNYTDVAASHAAAATSIHVTGTNSFTDGAKIFFETTNGNYFVATISTVDTTNITVSAGIPFAIHAGTRVNLLTTTTYTVKYPASAGEISVVLNSSTGLAADDGLVCVPVGGTTFRNTVNASAANYAVATMSLTASNGVALAAGTSFYKLTNSHALVIGATNGDFSFTANNATNLSAGDHIVISPASGGSFLNQYLASETLILNRINVTAAMALTLSPGDNVFVLGTATSLPIGAATVRRDNASGIFTAPQGRPARLLLDGTSACAVNQAIGDYGQ
jgi:hypothetical protein